MSRPTASKRRVVFLGATRGMGRSLARQMAARGDQLFLLGRNSQDLERSASDLSLATDPGGNALVGVAHCDLLEPATFDPALDEANRFFPGGFDTAVITAGVFGTQDELEADASLRLRVLQANYVGTVELCERLKPYLLAANPGTLCVFSSVAGDRGRKPVALYGSTKAGLSHYLESLDHRHRSDGLITVCVKPGFVKTSMTAALDPPPFAGEPESVARQVLKAIDRGKPVVYAPVIWRWVLFVIRRLPRFAMRRIGF